MSTVRPPVRAISAAPARRRRSGVGGRRGGDDRARSVAQPQPQLEIVPRLLGASPFGELVGPGKMVLRPAQAAGVGARISRREAVIGELELARAAAPGQPFVRPRRSEQAAFAFDHHLGDFVDAPADQRDARFGQRPRPRQHPFGPAPRLAEPAPGHHQPGAPFAGRLLLPAMRLRRPVLGQCPLVGLAEALDHVGLFGRCVAREQPDQLAERLVLGHSGAEFGSG